MVFNNIKGEIAKHQTSIEGIAKKIGLSSKSLGCKINGIREFKYSEMIAIHKLFPECTFEYLFEFSSTPKAS